MLLPEVKCSRRPQIPIPVDLLNAGFAIVAGFEITANNLFLLRRGYYACPAQPAGGLQGRRGGAAKQLAEQMLKPFVARQPPRGSHHPQYRAGPLANGPRPTAGGSVMGFVDNQQVVRVVVAPHIGDGNAAAHRLSHQYDRPIG